jgi:cobalt-precorrin-5B (C1)-methyltransferase
MPNRAKARHSDRTWRKTNLRSGYTTSACAAACSAAGIKVLIHGQPVTQVTIDLPGKKDVTFQIVRCEVDNNGVLCGTIKDSGDDPDVTHGTEIQAYVSWQENQGTAIRGGQGVGRVTKPGLPVPIGEAAINPGPRRLIERVVAAAGGDIRKQCGFDIEIRVPRGEELAQETMNPRLGIVGGISILGTSGILKPFSNSAYRASIHTELKVVQANAPDKVVLTTGSRSEQYAMKLYPDLPELAFIQVGDHMDYALKQCQRLGLTLIIISGMTGKISKLAQGRMQTHVSQGKVDFVYLGEVAHGLGADSGLVSKIIGANTAHHVQVMLDNAGIPGLEQRLTDLTAQACLAYASKLDHIEVLLFTIRGELLARTRVRREK